MNILTICSALNNSYIAISYEGKTITKTIESDENYHSLYLISKIKELFKNENMDFKKLDLIGVNTGQGSFTGIRVALTIAKVMASELKIPLISLNTTDILLKTYDANYLIMDARRDMYYLGDKNGTKLILKDEIKNLDLKGKIITDNRSKDLFSNAICYEQKNKDIGLTMLSLTKEKFEANNDDFSYLNVKANYIQTPPVF